MRMFFCQFLIFYNYRFLKSFEAKPYANRPEILLPAIANAFQV